MLEVYSKGTMISLKSEGMEKDISERSENEEICYFWLLHSSQEGSRGSQGEYVKKGSIWMLQNQEVIETTALEWEGGEQAREMIQK